MFEYVNELAGLSNSPWVYVIHYSSIVTTILAMVFIHYGAKHRNKKLSAGWYIGTFFFPLIAVIVFLNKRKRFPGPNMKVCVACGDKYPPVYEVCGRCLTPLPELDENEKIKEDKITKITGAAFWVSFAISTVASLVFIFTMMGSIFGIIGEITGLDDLGSRIGITDESGAVVYYDKMGNSYENADDVLLYGEDGTTYKSEIEAVEEDGITYDQSFYVSDKGETYVDYNCYVDEDGWFVFDEKEEFYVENDPIYDEVIDEFYDRGGKPINEDELIEYYNEIFKNYKYYEEPYIDNEGNIYYWASEASWNEKGELITAENDPTVE